MRKGGPKRRCAVLVLMVVALLPGCDAFTFASWIPSFMPAGVAVERCVPLELTSFPYALHPGRRDHVPEIWLRGNETGCLMDGDID